MNGTSVEHNLFAQPCTQLCYCTNCVTNSICGATQLELFCTDLPRACSASKRLMPRRKRTALTAEDMIPAVMQHLQSLHWNTLEVAAVWGGGGTLYTV